MVVKMALGDTHFYVAPRGHDYWRSRRAPVLVAIPPIGEPVCYSRDGNVWEDEGKHVHFLEMLGYAEISAAEAEAMRETWRRK